HGTDIPLILLVCSAEPAERCEGEFGGRCGKMGGMFAGGLGSGSLHRCVCPEPFGTAGSTSDASETVFIGSNVPSAPMPKWWANDPLADGRPRTTVFAPWG